MILCPPFPRWPQALSSGGWCTRGPPIQAPTSFQLPNPNSIIRNNSKKPRPGDRSCLGSPHRPGGLLLPPGRQPRRTGRPGGARQRPRCPAGPLRPQRAEWLYFSGPVFMRIGSPAERHATDRLFFAGEAANAQSAGNPCTHIPVEDFFGTRAEKNTSARSVPLRSLKSCVRKVRKVSLWGVPPNHGKLWLEITIF